MTTLELTLNLPDEIPAYLANALDRGEAAVIATALSKGIPLVCIDETVGRRSNEARQR